MLEDSKLLKAIQDRFGLEEKEFTELIYQSTEPISFSIKDLPSHRGPPLDTGTISE